MIKKDMILYLYPTSASFIKRDIEFLSKRYEVKVPGHNWGNKWLTPLNFLRQFLFLIRNVSRCRAIFVMFGGYWSFLPTLFGKIFQKKTYIILGGTDCVSFPSIDYGSLRKPLISLLIRWSYQLCHTLLPVCKTLVYCKYSYYQKEKHPYQGYAYFFPKINTPYRVIHNGFEPEKFPFASGEKTPNSFITVANLYNMQRIVLKGVDMILKLADRFTDCTFTIVGVSDDVKSEIESVPANVTLISFMAHEQLIQHLSENEFYLQLSISEGFPNAICEAMLCNCIPIGSSVGAIPLIIGYTGFIVERSDIEIIHQVLSRALRMPAAERKSLSQSARERIISHFPLEKREKEFFRLLAE